MEYTIAKSVCWVGSVSELNTFRSVNSIEYRGRTSSNNAATSFFAMISLPMKKIVRKFYMKDGCIFTPTPDVMILTKSNAAEENLEFL